MSETWQIIIQLVLLPTSIVGVLAFVMRELFKSYLSMDIERYRSELQSDLESHKAQLKAEFDIKHFEFQTRFSLFHQQRAEIIKELYRLLKESELSISWTANPNQDIDSLTRQKDLAIELLNNVRIYINKNRIFFSENICKELDDVCNAMENCLASFLHSHQQIERGNLDFGAEHPLKILSAAIKDLESKVKPLLEKLEKQFREILSAETSSYRLEKNNE
jgi:hypothetical protein